MCSLEKQAEIIVETIIEPITYHCKDRRCCEKNLQYNIKECEYYDLCYSRFPDGISPQNYDTCDMYDAARALLTGETNEDY